MWKKVLKEIAVLSAASIITSIGGAWSVLARDDLVSKIKKLRSK